jgi:hypothetical protein
MSVKQPRKPAVPYDRLWKGITTDHFKDFLAMFLPKLYRKVDFSKPFVFLEKELRAVVVGKTLTIADKLVKVALKDGTEKWVFVHIEFENSHSPVIKDRMFEYYCRIRAKYSKDIVALVVYTGGQVPSQGNIYEQRNFDTWLTYKFSTYEIINQSEEDLMNNPNPFAIVVLANLYVLQTQENDAKRLTLKQKIYDLAKQRKYPKEQTTNLILFITELMKLPPKLAKTFTNYISKPQKNDKDMMPITQASRNVADALGIRAYGKSIKELDNTVAKTIVLLYSQMQMSVEEIAEKIELEVKFVLDVLKKHKLIKK